MSVTFLDGPAQGQTLELQRAPCFLRVVRNERSEWDALDQLDDQPAADETVLVYHLTEQPTRFHVRRRSGSGWFFSATYREYQDRPPDGVLSNNDLWRLWCQDQGVEMFPWMKVEGE